MEVFKVNWVLRNCFKLDFVNILWLMILRFFIYWLEIKGSALAKHAERSSDRFQSTNRLGRSWWKWLAMYVINRLIAASCWQNIHAVPQHGAVFGIRVVDGYGAAC
ncbi:hypothetical protein NC653_037428 [Populus alba x Populus x berolinensis]|uniref:Uncharacterized protein n=1 Tax=Populus alba x Populus x berolinensis TaxID=444605 RepID=A0AAD6PTL8_9ROSI|nr:hypothetical protein NC653_037428 [Populus alba x Populus x berolinensis]